MSVLFNRTPGFGRYLATIDGPAGRWVIVARTDAGEFIYAILGSGDRPISEVDDPAVALAWISTQPTT